MKLASVVAELWIAYQLALPLSWAAGVTTRGQRCDRIRAEILGRNLADRAAGRRVNGSTETWAELFERVYQQPLRKET